MFETKVVEKIKTHILCSITFPENHAGYEIMWKIMVEPERPQMAMWRIRVECWISKATLEQAHASAFAATQTHVPTHPRVHARTQKYM